MKSKTILIALIVIFTACVTFPKTQLPTQLPSPLKSPDYFTPIIVPIPTPDHLTPEIVDLCPVPANRVVALNELGLAPETLLVLLPSDVDPHQLGSTGIWILSPLDSAPQYVPILDPEDGVANYAYEVSPDHRWVSFLRHKEGEMNQTLWISSLDGKQQWKVTQIGKWSGAAWVSEKEMVVIGMADEKLGEYEGILPSFALVPLFSILPFTLDKQDFLPIPEPETGILDREFYHYVRLGKEAYGIFVINWGEDFILQDLSNGSSRPIFQWLAGKDWVDSTTTRLWLLSDGTFTVTVTRPYGVDLASGLDFQTITLQQDYDKVMRRIILPGQMMPVSVVAGFPNTHFLLLEQTITIEGYYPPIDSFHALYLFDYQNMSIRNYCFNSSLRGDIIDISPDGHFLATTFYENPHTDSGDKWVVVLNLDTGYISYIPDFQFIGWGMDKDDK
jgi:hypothetical protein